ncbi:MAG TPA: 30S ribosomal protein THX [Bacteroidales bacterium]|nr:30S ribosomal protein THX [Bacteroidales bacterium]
MGKGDKKSRRGKIIRGSYGKTRPGRSKSPGILPTPAPAPEVKPEKVVAAEEPAVETQSVEKPAKPKAAKPKEKKETKAVKKPKDAAED